MSGDLGPRVAISASQKFVTQFPDVDLLLVGNEAQLLSLLPKSKNLHERITLVHASDVVSMHDDPLLALRQKKDSSMWMTLDLLRNNDADACVSAGNTGALLAIAKFLIKTFPAIERPAICKSMPVEAGSTYLLDLGANINCPPEYLHQFALMGSVLAGASTEVSPRVARFIANKISNIVNQNVLNRALSLLMWPLLKRLQRELDPSLYNGASFLGLQKTVIKSHGSADKKAFLQALIVAREQVIQNVPARIQQVLLNSSDTTKVQ
jgi:fatty acid/phospholipid biosynthesis enzyme